MAWKCLELRRGRSRKWLHEYYFFLAAYNVYAARFPSFREVRPLKTLFVGAGLAAYRYAYSEDLGRQKMELREVDALDRIAHRGNLEEPKASGESRVIAPWRENDIRRHRGDAAYAIKLARSRDPDCVNESLAILHRLMCEHPFVLDLAHEYAFALLESAQLSTTDDEREQRWSAADRFLKRAAIQFRGQMHQELLSRRGRLYKDQADQLLLRVGEGPTAGRLANRAAERVKALYRRAVEAYTTATEVSEPTQKYYPGINASTCWFLAGMTDKAGQLAGNVLEWVMEEEEDWRKKNKSDEIPMWIFATKGEAHVIAGLTGTSGEQDWAEEAKKAYKSALGIASREGELRHHSSAMLRQLERIFAVTHEQQPNTRAPEAEQAIAKLTDVIEVLKQDAAH
jgi:hypothetical protein